MGALIMTHSDDNGLVLPPHLAPIQVVIVPIYKNDEMLKKIDAKVEGIVNKLKAMGISVKYDNADNKRPGFKFADYELKGVPVRLVMGGRDLENNTMEVMRRDTLEKETRSCDGIEEYVQQLLEDIQNNIYQKALNYRNEHIVKVDSYDDFKEQIEKGGFILAHWDGTPETEDRIKEETKATIRCLPFDADEESLTPGKCMESMEELVAKADYITLHIPLNDKTRNTFDEKLFAATKPGARLLNFARGGLVDNAALKKAIADGIIARYMTDFPSEDLLGDPANIIVTPHLGASTPESEENCAIMAAQEIREYLTHGNIKNSVNYPACDMGICQVAGRIGLLHANIPNMIGQITSILAAEGINIANMTNKSRGDYAYSMFDLESPASPELIEKLEAVDGVLKVRVIC